MVQLSIVKHVYHCLVGGSSPTHLKNMQKSKWIISPGRDENKKCLKPPPRLCHLQAAEWHFDEKVQLMES